MISLKHFRRQKTDCLNLGYIWRRDVSESNLTYSCNASTDISSVGRVKYSYLRNYYNNLSSINEILNKCWVKKQAGDSRALLAWVYDMRNGINYDGSTVTHPYRIIDTVNKCEWDFEVEGQAAEES